MGDSKVHLIGNAHLDPVWLWRWQEGYAEIKATFQSALDRLDQFDDFVFTSACAAYYQWVEENAPEMFQAIKERVKEGRWCIVGGMWIQPDCNIPSGESFARHFLHSQNYFLEKFGRRATTAYNVDSFGHTGTLPKLLAGAGMDNYVMMRPSAEENPNLPGYAFWWQCDDGSRVLTFRIPDWYNKSSNNCADSFDMDQNILWVQDSQQLAKTAGLPLMHFYGVGNHGGGPTIQVLKTLKHYCSMPEGKNVVMSSPDDYFRQLRGIDNLPRWTGDMQIHAAGCYSAQWEIKRNNRRAENRLTSAEVLTCLAQSTVGYDYPAAEMDAAWKRVLFNQFHDIMGGCSIREAYEDAREAHGFALNTSATVLNAAAQRISWSIDTASYLPGGHPIRTKEKDWNLWEHEKIGAPIVVFNPLAWPRKISVQINRNAQRICDDTGASAVVQRVRASRTNGTDKWDSVFMADVPAMGWRLYWAHMSEKLREYPSSLFAGENYIENQHVRLSVEPGTGAISLLNKAGGTQILSPDAGKALVIDVAHCDTWAHGVFSFRNEVGRFDDATVELLESGPVRARLRVYSKYVSSSLRQDFILYADASQIEVEVQLDWHEQYKMVKLSWPVAVKDGQPSYQIPYGHITREADGREASGQLWFDVTGQGTDGNLHGLAVLNDGKYSFDVMGNDMRMTIANSSAFADHYAGENRDELVEFLDQGLQYFRYVLLPHDGEMKADDITKAALALNTEEIHIHETFHNGPLKALDSGIDVLADNVIVTSMKPALNSGAFVFRAYEAAGIDSKCLFRLPMLGRELNTFFTKYQIKTFLIPRDPADAIREVDLCEL